MNDYVGRDVDLYEVLNQFPILKQKLSDLHFSPSEVTEGESVQSFFEKRCSSEDEVGFLIRRLNRELKSFMRKNQTPAVAVIEKTPEIEIITENSVEEEEE